MSPTSPRLPAARHQHRASHLVHKQPPASSSSSSSSSNSSASGLTTTTNKNNAAHRPPPRQQHKQQQPVIIYTHSPKVIRTNPRDFMSIVQKLTGLDSARAATHSHSHSRQDDSSSSSADSCTNTCHLQPHVVATPPSYYVVHPHQQIPPPLPTTHFMPPEIPLFAPAPASDLPLCAYSGPFAPVMSSSPATATVFSPDVPFPDH